MAFNIADLFEHAVDAVPERVAVICGERRATYRELDERANRLAHQLAARGIGKGDHIGVYSRNSIEAIEAMYAAFKLRAVPVSVNYRYVADEVRYLAENADLVALIHERRYSDIVAGLFPRLARLEHAIVIDDGSDLDFSRYAGAEYEAALAAGSPVRDFGERSGDDIYMLYTGGTTGYPKGVVWRHEDVWRALGGGIHHVTGEYITDEYHFAKQAGSTGYVMSWLPAAPLIHAAQWIAFMALNSGGTVVLVPQFDAAAIWRAIEGHGVHFLQIAGDAMARPLLDAYLAGNYDTTSLVALSSGAALFSQPLKRRYLDTFPNLIITDNVGSSEGGLTGIGQLSKDSDHSDGPRVHVSKQAVLIGDDGELVTPEPGAVGRLARGGPVPLGYYKDPEKTAALFAEIGGERYVVPGDYARYEADGTVTLLGRGSECINTGGEKVFPEEVEGTLKSHPDVHDALVIGIPDDRYGWSVAAVVQPRTGATIDFAALGGHLRTLIAGYKVPRTFWIVEEIERRASGKADYPWAKRYAAANPERGMRYQ
ncbi:acyl-CoA synthetase [Nocardia yamanashiensis]|uniref:acyl-CoA synthetase n=1 Tax=Nocardia yamanashiensis TaxID=209247 RepID=UPI001E4D69AE|nr:acyl-CoA synthetase [Nocardia yamanashiensis]UGT39968.1 acyl-CoA synthetase [Nocardia yamanashiensis]